MKPERQIRRPLLAAGVRYRWDELRQQHQVLFPEGLLVLNESGAAIIRLCDGRSTDDLVSALQKQIADGDPSGDVHEFLRRLASKGILRDGDI